MNRIVLIGNGFDLTHGLPTRYEDFIDWYWGKRAYGFNGTISNISKDILCEFEIIQPHTWNEFAFQSSLPTLKVSGKEVIEHIKNNPNLFKIHPSAFYDRICHSIETKGWVDIENEYYVQLTNLIKAESSDKKLSDLNNQLDYITQLLAAYLNSIETSNQVQPIANIYSHIYSPIKPCDLSVSSRSILNNYIADCVCQGEDNMREKAKRYGIDPHDYIEEIKHYHQVNDSLYYIEIPRLYMLPDNILLLSFNYTSTSKMYLRGPVCFNIQIHGEINHPEKMIFGYGDEFDNLYSTLKEHSSKECLRNIKTTKYLESDNYRSVLSFIESAPFQVYIMGHSCGNSDRTLLNTLFEHSNCISIKPFYYIKNDGKDNYFDIIQNISRNFTDMKLMRDRVVNKTYCEPLT